MESLKGKLTEEEARELIETIWGHPDNIEATFAKWKKLEIIRQNPVKKAEEMEHIMNEQGYRPYFYDQNVRKVFNDAIEYLKNQVKELKNDK